jgi:alpha-mannosidase
VPTLKAVEKGAHHQVMILEHAYENEERKVKQLSWQTKITLYKGNRMVHIKTELDWEGSDAHLYVDVVPEFETNDKGIYEIPYAMIERDKPHMQKDRQGYHDEWPCHNWFGAQNGSDNLFIINKGLHGCRIIDNHMQLSLLRSPTEIWGCCIETGGAVETGHHTFEYAIASCKDGLEALNPSALGMRYNEPLFFTPARAKYGELPPKGSFIKNEAKNVLVTAVKLDDNGDRVIRAYEAYGKLHTEDSFGKALTPSDGLESPIGAPQERTTYHKFEIRTFIDKK